MSEEKLKPCPFCGGEASVYETGYMYSAPQYYICCDECGSGIAVFNTEQDAIEAWNRRVPQRTWTQKVYDSFGKMRDKE